MATEQRSIVFTLPPIGRWSKRLATAAVALWAMHIVLYFVVRPEHVEALPTVKWLALIPQKAINGLQLWRVLTYSMLDLPTGFDGIWSAIMLWFFGTPIEQRDGLRGIAIPWLVATLGGAAALLIASRLSLDYHVSAAMGLETVLACALLVKWGFLFARERVSFFGIAEMEGRVLAGVFCGISALNALSGLRAHSANAVVTLGGLLSVFLWLYAQGRMGSSGKSPRKRTKSGAFTVIKGGKSDEKKWVN